MYQSFNTFRQFSRWALFGTFSVVVVFCVLAQPVDAQVKLKKRKIPPQTQAKNGSVNKIVTQSVTAKVRFKDKSIVLPHLKATVTLTQELPTAPAKSGRITLPKYKTIQTQYLQINSSTRQWTVKFNHCPVGNNYQVVVKLNIPASAKAKIPGSISGESKAFSISRGQHKNVDIELKHVVLK